MPRPGSGRTSSADVSVPPSGWMVGDARDQAAEPRWSDDAGRARPSRPRRLLPGPSARCSGAIRGRSPSALERRGLANERGLRPPPRTPCGRRPAFRGSCRESCSRLRPRLPEKRESRRAMMRSRSAGVNTAAVALLAGHAGVAEVDDVVTDQADRPRRPPSPPVAGRSGGRIRAPRLERRRRREVAAEADDERLAAPRVIAGPSEERDLVERQASFLWGGLPDDRHALADVPEDAEPNRPRDVLPVREVPDEPVAPDRQPPRARQRPLDDQGVDERKVVGADEERATLAPGLRVELLYGSPPGRGTGSDATASTPPGRGR